MRADAIIVSHSRSSSICRRLVRSFIENALPVAVVGPAGPRLTVGLVPADGRGAWAGKGDGAASRQGLLVAGVPIDMLHACQSGVSGAIRLSHRSLPRLRTHGQPDCHARHGFPEAPGNASGRQPGRPRRDRSPSAAGLRTLRAVAARTAHLDNRRAVSLWTSSTETISTASSNFIAPNYHVWQFGA